MWAWKNPEPCLTGQQGGQPGRVEVVAGVWTAGRAAGWWDLGSVVGHQGGSRRGREEDHGLQGAGGEAHCLRTIPVPHRDGGIGANKTSCFLIGKMGIILEPISQD